MDEWFLEILWICCFCGLDHVSQIDNFNLDFYSKKTSYSVNVCKSTRQALETSKCSKQLETKNYFKIIPQAYEKSFQMIKFHFSWKRKSEDRKKKTCEKSSNLFTTSSLRKFARSIFYDFSWKFSWTWKSIRESSTYDVTVLGGGGQRSV
jgi:hypothetical protein